MSLTKPAVLTRPHTAAPVVLACAASAGIHAGLVPEHLREEPRVGVAFILATFALLAAGATVALQPTDRRRLLLSGALLGSLIVAYVASRSTGIPLLQPDPEAVDGVGVAAVLIELGGLLSALQLLNQQAAGRGGAPHRR
jgi:hypothetical protein